MNRLILPMAILLLFYDTSALGSNSDAKRTRDQSEYARANESGDKQPTAFLNMLEKISSCDLREIDHIGQIVGAKSTINPGMIAVSGRDILGRVDIILQSAPAAFTPPLFRYSIAIQGALSATSDSPDRNIIALMSFQQVSNNGCIDEKTMETHFGLPIYREDGFDSRAYSTTYRIAAGEGYTVKMNVLFPSAAPSCAVVMTLKQEADTVKKQ